MTGLPRATRVLDDAIAARVFPGAAIEVGRTEAALVTVARGTLSYDPASPPVDPDTIYDLASLTKVLSTAALALRLVERRALDLDEPVARWIPPWTGADRRGVTIRHLLVHASGLPDHRPYFTTLEGREAFERAIAVEPLAYEPGTRSLYSDAGFILLGIVIERAGGAPLGLQFDEWRDTALGPSVPLRFLPPPSWRSRTAPTERDPWRQRLLRGEVHDENAAALGGTAGHAGLFGTVGAVGACARWWLAESGRNPLARAFFQRSAVPGSSRALAWDTALPTSSCGTRMSATAVGHTGFTGTSLWLDPDRARYIAFLSNRVHPTPEGQAMAVVRPALHDAVADDLNLE